VSPSFFDPTILEARLTQKGLPPIERWDPEQSGEIDMRIARDGSWRYAGTPIARKRLMRLFSTVLRREDDGEYYLVTPVEKLRIRVDDAPFIGETVDVRGAGEARTVIVRTNVGDEVPIDAGHRLRIEQRPESREPAPYVHVRRGLDALLSRPAYYHLVDLAEEIERDGATVYGVRSAGELFELGRVEPDRDEDG